MPHNKELLTVNQIEEILERMPDYKLAGEIQRLHISTERGLAYLPLSA